MDQLAHDVVAAAFEVHKNIGPGYLESVYEEALFGLLINSTFNFSKMESKGLSCPRGFSLLGVMAVQKQTTYGR